MLSKYGTLSSGTLTGYRLKENSGRLVIPMICHNTYRIGVALWPFGKTKIVLGLDLCADFILLGGGVRAIFGRRRRRHRRHAGGSFRRRRRRRESA